MRLFNVSVQVGTKTAGECVQYYYRWKKDRTEEYKRLSMARRRRHEDELYQLRAASMSQWHDDTQQSTNN